MNDPRKDGDARARRGFLAAAGLAAAGMLVAGRRPHSRTRSAPASASRDALQRMQADLERALSRPESERSWGMLVDTRKCIGCRACVVACIAENTLPPGVAYRTVPSVEMGTYPDVRELFMPTNCYQCDAPPCREAAPPGAITKRPDGIVEFHYEKLRGAGVAEAVAKACPYGVVSIDRGARWTEGTPAPQPYEGRRAPEYGRRWSVRIHEDEMPFPRKCTFCAHRLEAGRLPACVGTCVGRAMYFGDLADEGSLVAELLRTTPALRLKEELGTKPRVVHLAEDPATCRLCHS